MTNGLGRGKGFARGFDRGMGFGFRGSSPPWPYVGIGRGGLPRCSYFLSGAGAPATWPYPRTSYYGVPPFRVYGSPASSMTKKEELSYLKGQAETLRGQLKELEGRIDQLSNEKE